MKKTISRLLAVTVLAAFTSGALAAPKAKNPTNGPLPPWTPAPQTLMLGPGDGPMPIKPCFDSPIPSNDSTSGMPRSTSHCGHHPRR